MAKYHELMERVQVSDAMRERLLRGAMTRLVARQRWYRAYALLGSLAAVAVIVLLLRPQPGAVPPTEQDAIVSSALSCNPYSDFRSAEELAAAVGFPVEDIPALPFAVKKVKYAALDGDLAEISYRGEADSLRYRKSKGSEDNSGDDTEYALTQEYKIEGISIRAQGTEDRYYLATWTDGSYAYSLHDEKGLDEESLLKTLRSMLQKQVD